MAATFWVGGRVFTAPAGSFVNGPRDSPRTFAVTSEQALFLLVVEPAGLERFARAGSEPARTFTTPPPPGEPPTLQSRCGRRRLRDGDPRPPGIPA